MVSRGLRTGLLFCAKEGCDEIVEVFAVKTIAQVDSDFTR